jgi:hypothetical protein
MRQHLYPPCIPSRATEVPTVPDWLHEIKHDCYRLAMARACGCSLGGVMTDGRDRPAMIEHACTGRS